VIGRLYSPFHYIGLAALTLLNLFAYSAVHLSKNAVAPNKITHGGKKPLHKICFALDVLLLRLVALVLFFSPLMI
jgi:hypothetical protein